MGPGDKTSAIGSSTHSSSMMDIDAVSSRASSVMDINMPIPISSEDDNTEEKIIQEAEDKISRSSASSPFDGLLFFFFSRKSAEETLAIRCICILRGTTESYPKE